MKRLVLLLMFSLSILLSNNYPNISQDINLTRLKTEKIANNKELVWIEAGSSDNHFFRLGNGFTKNSRETVNPMLDKLQIKAYTDSLECKKMAHENGRDGEYRISSKLTYLSSQLLGFEIFISYYCGGAYPDFSSTYYTVDINTAKKYTLKEILSISENKKKIRDLAFEEIGMKWESKKNLTKKREYDPYDLQHWEYLSWSLSENGIRFYLNFSTPERNFRGDYYEISFERLKPYLSQDFLKKLR